MSAMLEDALLLSQQKASVANAASGVLIVFIFANFKMWPAGLIPSLVATLSSFLEQECLLPSIYMAVTKRNSSTYTGLESALQDAGMSLHRMDVKLDQCPVQFLDVLDDIRSDVHLVCISKSPD